MTATTTSLHTIDELVRYVAETLAELESLRAEQFQLEQRILFRAGVPCGMFFCLPGPRALCLSAIWETERNTILFYGSCGRRIRRVQLRRAPDLSPHQLPTAAEDTPPEADRRELNGGQPAITVAPKPPATAIVRRKARAIPPAAAAARA